MPSSDRSPPSTRPTTASPRPARPVPSGSTTTPTTPSPSTGSPPASRRSRRRSLRVTWSPGCTLGMRPASAASAWSTAPRRRPGYRPRAGPAPAQPPPARACGRRRTRAGRRPSPCACSPCCSPSPPHPPRSRLPLRDVTDCTLWRDVSQGEVPAEPESTVDLGDLSRSWTSLASGVPVMAQMELGPAHGPSRTSVGTASLLAMAVGVPGALLIGLLAVPALLPAPGRTRWWCSCCRWPSWRCGHPCSTRCWTVFCGCCAGLR